MEYRVAIPSELGSFEDLWASCFEQPGEPFFEWFFRCYRPTGRTLGAWDGTALRSSAHLMPYRLRNRGVDLGADYLVGLATESDWRRQGIAGNLLAACLADMDKRGTILCVLMPAHPGFYYQYGWEIVYHHLRYQAAPRQLRQMERQQQPFAALGDIADWERLDSIYRRFVAGRNGYILRDAVSWRHLLEEHAAEGGSIALTHGEGKANAYILYERKDRHLNVVEMAYADSEGAAALYGFLYGQEAVDVISWDGPEDDFACYRLEEPQLSVRYHPFVAARIVNVLQSLRAMCPPQDPSEAFTLSVTDSLAPWNNSVFRLADGEGWLRCSNKEILADIQLDIGAFTQWYMGKVSLLALWKAGRIKGRPQVMAALDRWLPSCRNYIAEYF